MTELSLNIVLGNLNQFKKKIETAFNGGKGGAGGGNNTDSKKQTKGIGRIAALTGGIFGFLAGLVTQLGSIGAIIQVVAAILNSFVAPFVPILLGLMKPVFILLNILAGLMIKFFRDPVGMMQKAFEAIKGKVADLLGVKPEDIQTFVDRLKTVFFNIWEIIKGVGNLFRGLLTGDFSRIIEGVKKIVSSSIEILKNILIGLWDLLKVIFTNAWENLKIKLLGLWIEFQQGLRESLDLLKTIFSSAWDNIKEIFINAWSSLKPILSNIWESLKTTFGDAWVSLSKIINGLWESLKTTLTTSLDVLGGIGQWIWDKITGFFTSFGSFGGGGKRSDSINDGVITPDGKVIKTNPRDFLFATTNPSSLMGGGSNININIQGNTTQDTVDEIIRSLRSELNRRGANFR